MTQTRVNRQWIYKQRPQNAVGLEHFEMREGAVPKSGGRPASGARAGRFGLAEATRLDEDGYLPAVLAAGRGDGLLRSCRGARVA